jgi:hypothetical protein
VRRAFLLTSVLVLAAAAACSVGSPAFDDACKPDCPPLTAIPHAASGSSDASISTPVTEGGVKVLVAQARA